MAMKFNVGGNNSKQIVTEEIEDNDDDELEEDASTSSSNSNGSKIVDDEKKKLIRMMGLILIIVVILILFLFLITSLGSGKKTYEEIEEIMVTAAEGYFNDHKENLPKKDGGTQTIDVAVLVSEGRMKELSKYTDSVCTGSVKVEKSGSTYLYVPNLNCGDSYATVTLVNKVKEDNDTVSSGYGLYNKNGYYVFRGERVNNYVQLDNSLWRIVKISSGNELVLVKSEGLGTPVPWDDRYNQETNYNAGINNYSSSRIKEKLEELYITSEESVVKTLLSAKDKSRLVSYDVCSGKRGTTESGVEQAIECREITRDQKMGLLTVSDFMNASIDPECTNPSSLNCQNYNYLVADYSWWLVTAASTNSHDAYMVEANNGIKTTNTNLYARLRPVIHLNSEVRYKSGSGTEEDPYIVK